MYIDAHSHLAFYSGTDPLNRTFNEGHNLGIGAWVQGGYNSLDWKRQAEIKKEFPDQVVTCFGLHPWCVADLDDSAIEQEVSELKKWLPQAQFLGEVGLDHVQTDSDEDKEKQKRAFCAQLDLALESQKPLVLHVVQAHGTAQEILLSKAPQWQGLVHGFSSHQQMAENYIKMGFLISVGPGVLKPGYKKLKQAVKGLDLDQMVIESDFPSSMGESEVKPSLLIEVAEAVAQMKGVKTHEILTRSRENLEKIITNQ